MLIVLLLLVSKLDLFLGRQRHATSEIVNYIAVDAYRFGEFPWWLHYAWNYHSCLRFTFENLKIKEGNSY